VADNFRELWLAMMMVGIPEKHISDECLPGSARRQGQCGGNNYETLLRLIETLPTFQIANATSSADISKIVAASSAWINTDSKISSVNRIRKSLSLSEDFFQPFSEYNNLLRMDFSQTMAFGTATSATNSATSKGQILRNFRPAQNRNTQRCSFDALQHMKAYLLTISCHTA
jgi:hypothetical protein